MKDNFHSQAGIILKKIPYSEADEIITVLLHQEGIRRFFVTGSRKSKKRYQGQIDSFNHLRFFYKTGLKGLLRLQNVEFVNFDKKNSQEDLWIFGLKNYLSELICEFTPEAAHDHGLYDLWLELEDKVQRGVLGLRDAVYYILQILEKTGYAIDFKYCLDCGLDQLKTQAMFDPLKGGFLCAACRHGGLSDQKEIMVLAGLYDDEKKLQRFLAKLVLFSENIMQKKSKAALFFLDMMGACP